MDLHGLSMDIRGLILDIHELSMGIHGLSMDIHGLYMDINGLSMDIHAYPWMIHCPLTQLRCWFTFWVIFSRHFRFVLHLRVIAEDLWGNFGALWGQSRIMSSTMSVVVFLVCLTFSESIRDRSGSTLGPSWTTFG